MGERLVSKRELLELTGISYGQLYRWKRKNLIPENWFIKKSTFTGQETFFPKDEILIRINKIKDMKDELSLDELSDVFSSSNAQIALFKEELLNRHIVNQTSLNFFMQRYGEMGIFNFDQILYVYVLDKLLKSGNVSLSEGETIINTVVENYKKFEERPCKLMIVRKLGVLMCFLIPLDSEMYFENEIKVVDCISLYDCLQELKYKIA